MNDINQETVIIEQISNEDKDRTARIHQICQSSTLSNKERNELSDFTQEFGDRLSGPHVWNLLHQNNNEVMVYKRSTDPSCFTIFTIKIDDESKEISLHLEAICSGSRKRKEKKNVASYNLLVDNFNKLKTVRTKSDGDYALFDLEYRIRTIMACNEFREYKAKIHLGAINKEYVVAFYVRNGYNFDRAGLLDQESSLIPMKKTLQNTKEWKEFLEAFKSIQDSSRSHKMRLIYQFQKNIFMSKTLSYTGLNTSGQKYFVYTDGSYSYLNRDWSYRLSSIYHRDKNGKVDFVRFNENERRQPEESSDEEPSDEEQKMEEENQTPSPMINGQ